MVPIDWWQPVLLRLSPLMIFPMILMFLVQKLRPDKVTVANAVVSGFFLSGVNMINEVAARIFDMGEYIGGLQIGGIAVEVVPIFVMWGAILCIGLGYLLKRGYRMRVVAAYILLFTTISLVGDFRLARNSSISFRFYNWDFVWVIWLLLISAAASFFIWLNRKGISERFLIKANI